MQARDVTTELARALDGRVRGSFRGDPVARHLYSTDASPYRVEPAGVLICRGTDDVSAAVEAASGLGVPVTVRGSGTSLSGQCVGSGLQVDCASLDGIEWIDPERRIARVGPGATWWRLNREAARHGLEFGPDPATKRQCTLGGMVGTNAGGTHSIVYGAAVDHVHAVEAVSADGRSVRFEASPDGTLEAAGAPSALAEALQGIREATGPLLGPSYSSLARRGSGYQFEHLCTERPHLGRFLAGSEGTLALTTALELSLDPRPANRVLALVGFDDIHAALGAVPGLVETSPSAVELLSRSMIDLARHDPFHAGAVADIPQEPGAWLFVEYQGDGDREAEDGFGRMDAALDAVGGARVRNRFTDPGVSARIWGVREAGVGAMSSVAGGPKMPSAFVEDTVVAVDSLPGYIREFDRIFQSHEMEPVWYGHASTGLIHVRPFIDMTDAGDLERLGNLMRESVDLVRAWGGDLSGEHGDGLVRSYWNERLLGPEIYRQLKAVKGAFDPADVLNPGKVVDGPGPLEPSLMRYGPDYTRRGTSTGLSFDDYEGYAGAVERCFGAGVCRKRGVGTMCPPAAATGLEEHSTRARANLLRGVVSGSLDPGELSSGQAREVMETCVACKACKTECPARVDMARLKAEWMDHVRRSDGASPVQRMIGNFRTLAGLASRTATLANLTQRLSKRLLGIARERKLPAFASRPLTSRLPTGSRGPLLYPDCFTTYQEPGIGEDAAILMRAAGATGALSPGWCCGRVMLSEGYVEKARKAAARSAELLRGTTGPILFVEPSCLSAVTDDWRHLIGDVDDIASRCRPVEAWVAEQHLSFRGGGRTLLHGHCHQKALRGTGETERALGKVDGLDVEVLDAGCCGMAGAFGYLADRYELSVAMAERVLLPAVRGAPDAEVVATGTSCRHQVGDLAGRRAVHPVTFLAERLL